MRARRARPTDAAAIHRLIAAYAAQGLLLPRLEEEIREHVARFLVLEEKNQITGCVALEGYGPDLAEIRSLAVNPEIRGHGLGARLVIYALAEARRRKIARVFAVTHAPEFFLRQGFALSKRQALAEKIERDCSVCPKSRRCRLSAVVITVIPDRIPLNILDASASPAPVA
jgi:amino-acid N-acetyltransferase